MRIQILYGRCPPLTKNILKTIGQVLVLFLLVILVLQSGKLVRIQFHTMTTNLMLPYSLFSISMLLSVLLMLTYTVLSFIQGIRDLKEKKSLKHGAGIDHKKGLRS